MRKFIKALLVSAFLVAVLGSSSQAFAAKPDDPFQPIFPDFQIEIAHGDLPVNQPIPLTLKPEEIHIFTIPCENNTTLMMVETLGTTETHFNLKGTVHGTIVNDVGYTGTDNASIGFRNEPGKTFTLRVSLGETVTAAGDTTVLLRRQQACLYGFDYGFGQLNTTYDLLKPAERLRRDLTTYAFENQTAAHILSKDERDLARLNSEVFYLGGHGTSGYLVLPTKQISSRDITLTGMSTCKIAFYATCLSADSNNSFRQSIVEASVYAGAKSAIGWPNTISSPSVISFATNFFTRIYEGASVEDSARFAAGCLAWPWDTVKNYRIAGDPETVLADSIIAFQSQNNMLDTFRRRTAVGTWMTFDANGRKSFYQTVNGILTNDRFEVTYDTSGCAVYAEHYGPEIDPETLAIQLPQAHINTAAFTKYHDVYIRSGEILLPVRIVYTDTCRNGLAARETRCFRLTDGAELDPHMILEAA